jgi:hypothetical protein
MSTFIKYIFFIFNIFILSNYVLGIQDDELKSLEKINFKDMSQQQCADYIILKFVNDFSDSKNLCNFCKEGISKLELVGSICRIATQNTNATRNNNVNKDVINDTISFLHDFGKLGSCETVCDCIDPKPIKCPIIGKCCEGCVCAENIVGDGIDGYSATIKEGCTSLQFWADWTNQTTQKCTTKKFN